MAKKKSKKKAPPKRIAGVKIPKAVRKAPIGAFLASKSGQALIAEAVMALGAAAGAKKASDSPKVRRAAGKAAQGVQDAGIGAGAAGGVLAYALGEAARSFVDALRDGRSDPERAAERHAEWTNAPADGADRPSKKKPIAEAAGTA